MTEVTNDDDYNVPLVQLDETRGEVKINIAGAELKIFYGTGGKNDDKIFITTDLARTLLG